MDEIGFVSKFVWLTGPLVIKSSFFLTKSLSNIPRTFLSDAAHTATVVVVIGDFSSYIYQAFNPSFAALQEPIGA